MVSVRVNFFRWIGFVFLLVLMFSKPVYATDLEFTEAAELSWETVRDTLWDILVGEMILLRNKIPSLIFLMILIGIKNCMEFPVSLTRTVHLGIFCALALSAGELFRELAAVAENCVTYLSEFMYMTIPILTGLIANGGRVLSSVKSTYFVLGFMNVLMFLIKNIFFPGILVYFMCAVLSPLLEKDYFGALKKVIFWSIKTMLPILIGIFMMVFTLLITVTKASDTLTLQSAKLALGNCIPFLGGSLSDSGEYLIQTISHIKAKAGLAGVFAMAYAFLSPILKLVAGLLAFRGLSVCAGFLSDEKTTLFFEDTATSLGMLTGIVATVSVISILGIMILMGI